MLYFSLVRGFPFKVQTFAVKIKTPPGGVGWGGEGQRVFKGFQLVKKGFVFALCTSL